MLIKPHHSIFILTLFMGTLITCTASSWILAWVGLEINLMSFIPLILIKLNSTSTENTIKYFLVQALASITIISCILIMSVKNSLNFMNLSEDILIMSLGLKAGVAPVHFWFPQIMATLNWTQSLILLTWQKIAPLILMATIFSWVNITLILTSSIMGAMMGLNQVSFKKILTFSSIINASWLMAAAYTNMNSWWFFFLSYSLIVASVMMSISFFISNWVYETGKFKINNIFILVIIINMLSLAGMPPFTGFFLKIMILETLMLTTWFSPLIMVTMIMSSFIAFYFYMRVLYNTLFQANKMSSFNFMKAMNSNHLVMSLLIFSIMMNLFLPAMVYLS